MENTKRSKALPSKYFMVAFMVFILFMISHLCAYTQNEAGSSHAVYPVFGVGFGFFGPGDVNDYIEEDLGSYAIEYGTKKIFAYYELHAGLTFRTSKIDFTALFEFAMAPKLILVTGSDDNISYFFNRLSPGTIFNYYIPVGSGRNNMFIGGGVHYHFMRVEDFKSGNVGFRIQAGVDLTFGRFNLQPYGAFQYAKAQDKNSSMYYESFELNYTGGQIGVFLSFHGPVGNK